MLVNLQDQNTIAEIDPATDSVSARYHVAECKGNHGMVLDADHRRAFLVCGENDRMAVFDLDTHKTVATVTIPAGGDVIKYDPGLRRIYVACSSGAIAVIQKDVRAVAHRVDDQIEIAVPIQIRQGRSGAV